MDNLTVNKSHIPCQSWVVQNGWSTASTLGPVLTSLPGSQHLRLGSSSDQRPSYNQLQESNQSCMSDLSALSSRNNSHHSALYKAAHISSDPSSGTLFANTPGASHAISFAQQNPHASSMLLNQGKNIPTTSLPQACRPQHLPLLSAHGSDKAPFQPPLINQGLPNGPLPVNLPSCGQRVSAAQATFEGGNVEFAGVAGYAHSHASSTPQEQREWTSSSRCRGAVNNAAAHSDKEPSQKEKTSPVASTEKVRLLLLHQRTQLLQQVAELDKILESLPPESSSDVQPPLAAPQSPLSSDGFSPVSYNAASDSADEPASAADLEVIEHSPVESEVDSDPDYNSDVEFSDVKSEPEWGLSDDSSHSRTSNPENETPEKTRAKAGSSLLKDKSATPQTQIRALKPKKKAFEAVVLPSSNSKTHRVYDRKNYCLFCSRPMSKMSRHFERIHSDKPEVAAAFQHPPKSKERHKIWNRLINQGNFAHNKDVLKTGKGQLAVRKRPNKTKKAQDFLHCLYCHGLFGKKAVPRHMKICPERVENENEAEVGRKRIASRCVLEAVGDLGLTDGFKNVLSQMIYDDVTEAVMEDEVILQFGEVLFSQHGSRPKRHPNIRQNIRQMARLLLEAQKITPVRKVEDFFLPSSFPHVVSAVNAMAGYNAETKTYSVPSLAVKIGYSLQKACGIVEANAVKRGDASLAESARNFLTVYEKEWNNLISAGALTTLKETKQNTEKKVPFAKDVKRLNFHLEKVHHLAEKNLRESPSAENFTALARVVLARTILFNRRRPEEVSSLQLTAFMARKKSNSHHGMDISVSDLEKNMCRFFTRIDIPGMCGRTVPILLKPSFVSAMELLTEVRKTCGVPSKNPFMFARPHALSSYRGSCCIQLHVKACGVKNPELLTLRMIQKHYATMLQLINLDEDVADQILGPNNRLRRLRQDRDMQQDDAEMDCDETGEQAASLDEAELSAACYEPSDVCHEEEHGATAGADTTRSVNSGKKGPQNNGKQKWEDAEILAVERHMMTLIQEHRVPQKSDCIQCLDAEPEALKTRSWKGVKDYVRNRITALKRQRRSSQVNRGGQAEPRRSAKRFHQL